MRHQIFAAAAAAIVIAGAAYAAVPAAPPASPCDGKPCPEGRTVGFGRRIMVRGSETRAEAEARAKEMFARLDTNKDGVVTREEARAAVESFRAGLEQRRKYMTAKRFDALDTNHDGQLSREEYAAGGSMRRMMSMRGPGDMPPPPGPPPPPGAPDGSRWAGGPPPPMPPMPPMPSMEGLRDGALMTALFDRIDANKDGKVTLAEMIASADMRFATIDTNGDGVISEAERRAAHPMQVQTIVRRPVGGWAPPPPPMM